MRHLIPAAVAASLVLGGCLTEDRPVENPAKPQTVNPVPEANTWTPEENQRFRDLIVEQGFSRDSIVDLGAGFQVEGDFYFPKGDLLDKAVPLAKSAHYRSQYQVRDELIHKVFVDLDPSLRTTSNDWYQAWRDACEKTWDTQPYLRVYALFAGTAPIMIKPGAGTYATFPNSAGSPGATIYLNKPNSLSLGAKTQILVHLIGHTLGIHHTNGTAENGNNPYAQIPWAPASDPASVFNSGYADTKTFAGFTAGDKDAFRRLYSSILRPTTSNPYRFMVRANADNRDDQLFWDEDGIWVALGNSNGTFSEESRWTNSDMAWTSRTLDPEEVPLVGDINGDGRTDAVFIKRDRVVGAATYSGSNGYATSTWGTQMTYNDTWRTASNPRMLADVNGDGKADLVGFASNGVLVGLSTGFKFQPLTFWSSNFGTNLGWNSECPRFVVDVNKDGAADVVAIGYGGIIVATSNKSGAFINDAYWTSNFGYNDGYRAANTIRDVVDVTGDGYPDIVAFATDGVYVGKQAPGQNSFGKVKWSDKFGGWDKTKYPRYLADINGDGKMDIVGFGGSGTEVGVSNGTSAFNYGSWHPDFGYAQGWRIGPNTRMVGDVNGDGKADIVCNTNSEGIVGLSTGSSFAAQLSY